MTALTIGVLTETASGEHRVALDPGAVTRLTRARRAVLIEAGAGVHRRGLPGGRRAGSGVWSRDTDLTYRASQDILAGRVWVNTYHQYPAGAGFGGYKQSGYGRETDRQTLHNYQEVKNMLVNHDPKPLGFFA